MAKAKPPTGADETLLVDGDDGDGDAGDGNEEQTRIVDAGDEATPTVVLGEGSDAEEPTSDREAPTTPPKPGRVRISGGKKKAVEINPPLAPNEPLPTRSGLAVLRTGDERYLNYCTLGEGGMGRVYLVDDRDLHRQVAMKVVRTKREAHTARFLDEAQILGQLEHPNIVPLYDIGTVADGQPFCTLRYVKGEPLDRVLVALRKGEAEATRTYSMTRLVQIFLQIAQAIDYAHSKRVIHRDLKPANIKITEDGERSRSSTSGLAKVLGEDPEDAAESRGGDLSQSPTLTRRGPHA